MALCSWHAGNIQHTWTLTVAALQKVQFFIDDAIKGVLFFIKKNYGLHSKNKPNRQITHCTVDRNLSSPCVITVIEQNCRKYSCSIREDIDGKNLLLFGKSSKGVGGHDRIQTGWGTFCCCLYLQICDARGDGFTQIQTILGTFLLEFGLFPERGGLGWWPNSKHFEELFVLWFGRFPRKIGKDDQIKTFWGTLFCQKYGFRKSSSKDSKNTGGGGG